MELKREEGGKTIQQGVS